MNDKIRIGISSCLLGEMVRYDGGHQIDRYLCATLDDWFEYVPVCPGVEPGRPTPCETLLLIEGDAGPHASPL